ncbi:MAG: polymorphic toxin-type HINT domain-containing protein, partial [Ktedonobacteraceae bacterium]
VWSYNPQAKKMELEPIQKVWLNHDNDLVDLTLVATVKDAQGKTTELKEVIHTNEKHPFLTKEKGFIPVSQLKPGMHVLEANGDYGVVGTLVVVPGAMWMYNLTVAQDHTYVVGLEQSVVHNCGNGFPNKMSQNLSNELNEAKNLGVQPMSADDPGFSNMVNQGPVKWAVNQAGDLRFVPKFVNGTEIFHSVLAAGASVLAVGEADIAAAGDDYWVADINNYSGHFQPDLDSLENIAKPLFRALGFLGL